MREELIFDCVFDLLNYDSNSGNLFWKIAESNAIKSGDLAGTKKDGYIRITIRGNLFYAHRIAWILYYGEMPKFYIDHIDGNASNNKIENLRDVPFRENCQNRIVHRKGNLFGATWHKQKKKWRAQIRFNGKQIHLGFFDSAEQAHEEYKLACKAQEVGIIPRPGESWFEVKGRINQKLREAA